MTNLLFAPPPFLSPRALSSVLSLFFSHPPPHTHKQCAHLPPLFFSLTRMNHGHEFGIVVIIMYNIYSLLHEESYKSWKHQNIARNRGTQQNTHTLDQTTLERRDFVERGSTGAGLTCFFFFLALGAVVSCRCRSIIDCRLAMSTRVDDLYTYSCLHFDEVLNLVMFLRRLPNISHFIRLKRALLIWFLFSMPQRRW